MKFLLLDLRKVWGMKKKISKVHWVLDAKALAELRKCEDCKSEPAVFLTAKKVPCCRLNWEKFADDLDGSTVAVEVPNCQLPDRVNLDFDECSLEAVE